MLVLQGGRLLKKGKNIFRYRHLFLHLLAMCVQKCMKGRREGGKQGGGRVRNGEGGKGEGE